jgi:hypothetical protein
MVHKSILVAKNWETFFRALSSADKGFFGIGFLFFSTIFKIGAFGDTRSSIAFASLATLKKSWAKIALAASAAFSAASSEPAMN